MSTRRSLYRTASLLGWTTAARKGRLPQRAWNVFVWRKMGKAARKLSK